MPVTKSAIKKLRQDKKRTAVNKKIKQQLVTVVKGVKQSKKISLEKAFSKIDRAAKSGAIHKNKAARLKSQVSKIAPKKTAQKKAATAKKTPKKSVAKAKKESK